MADGEDRPIIELEHVALHFGTHAVHRDLCFSMRKGESVTLLGPSGIGKTLILKMIIGLIRPTSGSVVVMGHKLHELPEQDLQPVRRHIGMLFQGAALFDSLTVFENVAYSLREARTYGESEIRDIVEQKLEIVGLPGVGAKLPSQLSGGQKKRVGLARALASSPGIMLFDEPTTGLDPTATRLIDDLIVKLNHDYGMTAVSVTHDIESAKRISARWLLINNGVVAADGPAPGIAAQSREVADFITGNWSGEISLT